MRAGFSTSMPPCRSRIHTILLPGRQLEFVPAPFLPFCSHTDIKPVGPRQSFRRGLERQIVGNLGLPTTFSPLPTRVST